MNTLRGLTLIPTPLHEDLPLEPVALELLKKASESQDALILVEELKVARIRWLRWGLPRGSIERFVVFNEHTETAARVQVLTELKAGRSAVLMSDGGMPAFCDPGRSLVEICHDSGVPVTSSPFPNSVILALALSGFDHSEFYFAGFLPAESKERKAALEKLQRRHSGTLILMDTPYRLHALLQDLGVSSFKGRKFFLATELNSPSQRLFRGKLTTILSELGSLKKAEFVLVIEQFHP